MYFIHTRYDSYLLGMSRYLLDKCKYPVYTTRYVITTYRLVIGLVDILKLLVTLFLQCMCPVHARYLQGTLEGWAELLSQLLFSNVNAW